MTTVSHLYDLQQLDLEIDDYQANLTSIMQRIQDNSSLVGAQYAVKQRSILIEEMQDKQVRLTHDINELNDKRTHLETRMYDGSIRNTKEVKAAQREVDNFREQVQRIENNELLPLMVDLEENQTWFSKASLVVKKMESERGEIVRNLDFERTQVEGKLPALKHKRQNLVASLIPTVLSQYESLRNIRQGRAIAKVEQGRCTGCQLKLPARELSLLRAHENLVRCSSCDRILYSN